VKWTKDERDSLVPIKPFPPKDYLKEYIRVLHNEDLVALDKSRQMMATTGAVLYADWTCRFGFGRKCYLNKNAVDEAEDILKDKVRFPFTQEPKWLQEVLPMSMTPKGRIYYPRTGSEFIATDQNSYAAELRGNTASLVIVDESARNRKLRELVEAVLPMSPKLFLLTTADIGNAGAEYHYQLLERDSV
jgi:hypothetical protein